jgi:uncharacterized membrane protein
MWDWRAFLMADEAKIIERADRSAERIERARRLHEERHGRARQLIVNRAIHRAKYAAAQPS